ncbi:hypothetical protein BDZ91DRAFT_729435 [Kalaharituber pfeilii]|nr:hypothetical protein BDZ91DRAFT_729435 [Kalaharituber pfeilii]
MMSGEDAELASAYAEVAKAEEQVSIVEHQLRLLEEKLDSFLAEHDEKAGQSASHKHDAIASPHIAPEAQSVQTQQENYASSTGLELEEKDGRP